MSRILGAVATPALIVIPALAETRGEAEPLARHEKPLRAVRAHAAKATKTGATRSPPRTIVNSRRWRVRVEAPPSSGILDDGSLGYFGTRRSDFIAIEQGSTKATLAGVSPSRFPNRRRG